MASRTAVCKPGIADAGTQQRAKFELVFLSEAQVECAIDGEPYPVAGLAKMLRNRRDETDPEAGAGDLYITCRPARRVRARVAAGISQPAWS